MTNQRLIDATKEAFPNYTKQRRSTHRPGSGRHKVIDREEVRTRTLNGQSLEQIAHDLGYSVRGISNVRAELGITHPRMVTPEKLAAIATALQDGWSHAEISRTHNTTHETIERHFPGSAWTPEQRAEHMSTLRLARTDHWGALRRTA